MKHRKTPKPGTVEYNTNKPQDLNDPKFHSSTQRRQSNELPAVENMDNPEKNTKKPPSADDMAP